MSTETYSYAAIFEYTIKAKSDISQCSFYATDDVKYAFRQRILAELRDKMAAQAVAQFSRGFTEKEAGHWFNVGAVTSEFAVQETRGDITFITPFQWDYGINYEITAKTAVQFQTDISDPKAMASPQLEAVVVSIIAGILGLMAAQPVLFLLIIAVIAVIIGAAYLQSQGGLASLIGGPGAGGQIIGAIVLVGALVAAVVIVPPLLKGRGPQIRQYGRRAYRKVRG